MMFHITHLSQAQPPNPLFFPPFSFHSRFPFYPPSSLHPPAIKKHASLLLEGTHSGPGWRQPEGATAQHGSDRELGRDCKKSEGVEERGLFRRIPENLLIVFSSSLLAISTLGRLNFAQARRVHASPIPLMRRRANERLALRKTTRLESQSSSSEQLN